MPTYEYECEKCGRTSEVEQRMSDAPITSCPLPDPRTVEERMRAFNDETACLRGGNRHRDRCTCQRAETGPAADTPHKHHAEEAPFSCARCVECDAYKPALELPCGGPVKRVIAGRTGFVLKGSGWFKDGY